MAPKTARDGSQFHPCTSLRGRHLRVAAGVGKLAGVLVLIIAVGWITGQQQWAMIFAGAAVGVSLAESLTVSKHQEFCLLLGVPVVFATVSTLVPFVQQSDFGDPKEIALAAMIGALTAIVPAAIASVSLYSFSAFVFRLTGVRLFHFD